MKVILKKSKIEGKGVFAKEDISKKEEIIEYTGELISKEEGTKRADSQLEKGHVYIFELNDKYDIDGSKNKIAKYINHSCEPNCESVIYNDKEIWIVAIKDIKKGEELTFDYELTGDKVIRCNCGSKKCRKFI
tara:strand:+ start:260 stop:658 length:399 start_codon:yes stop_codon:yes gene_type:complete